MPPALTAFLLSPCLGLFAAILLPSKFANRHVDAFRSGICVVACLNAAAAAAMLAITFVRGPTQFSLLERGQNLPFQFSVYIDGVSTLMLTLVAIVAWVICRFSVRYLDGEPNQGSYFRWTSFTIGAVSLFVVAGNLVVMVLALLLTSIGLHQLLVHYVDRPTAHRAAGIKFFFSRLGDVSLIGAAVLLYGEFGTLELPQMFTAARSLSASVIDDRGALFAAACLIGSCAIFKSAQFPFHTWLPETMEAPTPVSALMHAGIVNAGGYVLIRMSPIVSLSPAAMWMIAGMGALTAIMAAVVMLPQTSVKGTLAWSTIAQMGFMILQCGLGAFSAAMLHIIAHSLYKAHAFLSSGSVMTEAAGMVSHSQQRPPRLASGFNFGLSAFVVSLLFLAVSYVTDVTLQSKPGGYLLGLILCMGLMRWMSIMLANGPQLLISGVTVTTGLLIAYLTAFNTIAAIVGPSVPDTTVIASSNALMVTVAIIFAVVLTFEILMPRYRSSKWSQRLYVHAANGFYVDVAWRRAAKSVSA